MIFRKDTSSNFFRDYLVSFLCCCLLGLGPSSVKVRANDERLPLVPYPKKVVAKEGAFTLRKNTTVVIGSKINREDANGAEIFNEEIEQTLGNRLPVEFSSSLPDGSVIAFDGFGTYPLIAKECSGQGFTIPGDLPAEGYYVSIRTNRILAGARDRSHRHGSSAPRAGRPGYSRPAFQRQGRCPG